MKADLPIGVFDSGLGGLTVVHQLRRVLPDESIIYLGDTARVPYGTRSPSTVIRYARGCSKLLIDRGIKLLVVACNTVSAVALDILRAELDLPVLGVVGPGAGAAVAAAQAMEAQKGHPVRIGVMGTVSTIASGAYPREVHRLSTRAEVCTEPAPLLVPLVEEGWLEGEVPRLAVQRYVKVLTDQGARVLVLGCTHYPLLKSTIAQVAAKLAGEEVVIVDSAEATAHAAAELLQSRAMTSNSKLGQLELLVTDMPASFSVSAGRFLGEAVGEAVQVDITPY